METPETQQPGSPDAGQTTDASAEAGGAAESASVKRREADEAQPGSPPRRKLSDDQEHELTQLYAETPIPTLEIARRFGIAESSVYRVVRRHGAALRGRPAARARPEHAASAGPAAARRPFGAVKPGMPEAAGGGTQAFHVRFNAEVVFEAADIRGALRQAGASGITEVTSVIRDD